MPQTRTRIQRKRIQHGVDGNKRTSLLVMFILLTVNDLDIAINRDWSIYYKFAKKIASEGTQNREANISELAQILRGEK